MNPRKRVLRHGLVGGGLATLVLALSITVVLGVPRRPSTLGVIFWLLVVGGTMLLAGFRERVWIGSRSIGWPRIAAVAIAALAVGWAAVSTASLLEGDGITGIGPLEAVITIGIVGYFGWFARECWAGGVLIDEETFTVE